MIQLFIDQTELNLSEDLEFQLIDSNPLITETGEYSFDITISLLEPRNAKAFRHINRINNTGIKTEYDADLIIDLIVRKGTATVLSHTDATVTIQLLFGNAEMNFSIEDDKKIWELGWARRPANISFEFALGTLQNPSYIQNWVCAPVMVGDEIINKYTIPDSVSSTVANTNVPIIGVENIIPQPYLLYYINRLPDLLGFSLKANTLNNDLRAQKMFILNTVDSDRYADALPDMTISEFVQEVENFFNVRFLVNRQTKEISIVRLKESLQTKKTVTLKNVINSYERTIGSEADRNRLGFTRIGYDIGNDGMYRYLKLSDEILEKCEIKEYETLDDFLMAVSIEISVLDRDKHIIYRVKETSVDYIFTSPPQEILFSRGTTIGFFHNVNKLRDYGVEDVSILNLKIVPAQIKPATIIVRHRDWSAGGASNWDEIKDYQIPVSSLNSTHSITQTNLIIDIEDGLIEVPRTKNLEVAFITGILRTSDNAPTLQDPFYRLFYPFSHIDNLPEFSRPNAPFHFWLQTEWIPKVTETFRLNGKDSILSKYQTEQFLDMSKEYVFTVLDSPEIDSDNIFEYNGQRYMPIRFERKASNKIKHPVTGYFYRML